MLVMGSLLNITNITDWNSLDFNEVLSIAVLAACIAASITLIILTHSNFEQLKDKKSPSSLTWGAHISEIRIPRILNDDAGAAEWALNSIKLSIS
jgi:hypothetical protein